MTPIDVELNCEALPPAARVVRADGVEGIDALVRWEIVLSAAAFDGRAALGASAVLRLADHIEGSARLFELLVIGVARLEDGRDGPLHAVTLCSPAWLLTQRSGYRTFLDKTTKEIVTEVTAAAGLATTVVWRLSAEYEKRLYCVQYGETEWAFLERLLSDEGISYWFDVDDDDQAQLVFADDAAAYESIKGEPLVPFTDPSGEIGPRQFYELLITDSMAHDKVLVRDYDVRAPDTFVEGRAGDGAFEHYEFPAGVLLASTAETRARARLDQLRRFQRRIEAKSDCVRVQPGRIVEIDGCSDGWMNTRYVVVEVVHELRLGSRSDDRPTAYAQRSVLVPYGERPFRPALPHRVPKVAGIEPGFTTGPSGEEIHVDDLGRVKIRLPWDRSGVDDDTTSFWVRTLQPALEGGMILPRVGWEVPVAYMNGNPDRPFVLGRVYNSTLVVPYGLPSAQATSSLQSATSPADGTTNEIRMVDDGGSQEMFIHATKDQTVTVGGSNTSDVGADETHDIGLSLLASVTASQTHTVGGNQNVDVGTNHSVVVKGARTEMIAGLEANKVTANRVVADGGAYTELIGALYGIQCNQSNTGVLGAFTQLVGGGLSRLGGLGVSETVIAARNETVGGSKTMTVAGGVSDNVIGAKTVTAGAEKEKAGGKISTKTAATGAITVSGSASIKAGGPLVIEAPSITIEAASIKTPAFDLAGGALKVKKGKSSIKGTIKREAPSKLGS